MVDDFGVPESLIGEHPDWFFPALGRVVAVCAVLETRALELAESLAQVPQGSFAKKPIATLKANAHGHAEDFDAINADRGVGTPITKTVDDYFDRILDVMERRHAVVHANWPAQPGDIQHGWRYGRSDPGPATRVTADNTRDKLVDLIKTASDLVMTFEPVSSPGRPKQTDALPRGGSDVVSNSRFAARRNGTPGASTGTIGTWPGQPG